jgi:hypothetical protein
MLSTSDGRMDKAILTMWQDGLNEMHCQGKGRMEFDDFRRFLKGQVPMEQIRRASLELSPRTSLSSNLILSSSSAMMQTVPEGSVSPMTPREKVTTLKFDPSDNLNIPSLPGVPSLTATSSPTSHKKKAFLDADISIPPDDLSESPPGVVRSSSVKLYGSQSWLDDDSFGEIANPALQSGKAYMRKAVNRFQELSTKGDLTDVGSPAAANEALFKPHIDFRNAVYEASKVFEQKRKAREITFPSPSAKMTMKRGQRSDRNLATSNDEKSNVAEATRRSGRLRSRHPRKRTASDITGLLR